MPSPIPYANRPPTGLLNNKFESALHVEHSSAIVPPQMKIIEPTANVVLIVAAIVFLGTRVNDFFERRATPSLVDRSNALLEKYKDTPPTLTDLRLGRSATIALFVSKDCQFCTRSMPFYKRLFELQKESPRDLNMVAYVPAGAERREDGIAYFAENGVALDAVDAANFKTIGVPGTPTILLLDERGHARGVWVGTLSGVREAEFLTAVKQLCPVCKGAGGLANQMEKLFSEVHVGQVN
jgi:hypothetical protein